MLQPTFEWVRIGSLDWTLGGPRSNLPVETVAPPGYSCVLIRGFLAKEISVFQPALDSRLIQSRVLDPRSLIPDT